MRDARPHSRPLSHGEGRSSPVTGLLPLVVLLTVWQVTTSPRSASFPPPSTWPPALIELWHEAALVGAVSATVATFSIALILATAVGATLGIAVGALRRVDRALSPSLEFLRATPPAAMVPVATLLLGYDQSMKVTVVTLAAIWPILLNTRSGAQRLDGTLLDTAKSLRLDAVDRIGKVVVPALLPSIVLGVRVAAPVAVVITLLVEVVTGVDGVGALIAHAQRTFQPARVYALMVVAGVMSALVNAVVGAIETAMFRNRPRP